MSHWHVVTDVRVRGITTSEPSGYFEDEQAARAAAEQEAKELLGTWQAVIRKEEERLGAMLAAQALDAPWGNKAGIPPDSVVPVSMALDLIVSPPASSRLRWEGPHLVIENPPPGFAWSYRVEECPHPRSECLAAQEALGFPDWERG